MYIYRGISYRLAGPVIKNPSEKSASPKEQNKNSRHSLEFMIRRQNRLVEDNTQWIIDVFRFLVVSVRLLLACLAFFVCYWRKWLSQTDVAIVVVVAVIAVASIGVVAVVVTAVADIPAAFVVAWQRCTFGKWGNNVIVRGGVLGWFTVKDLWPLVLLNWKAW